MSTPDPATTPWVPLWALGVDAVPLSTKAQPSGVASLGADGKVPASQLPASALAAGTAIIGTVSAAGGILAGSGFTVARTALGNYTVTFATPFASVPTVVVSPIAAGGGNWAMLRINPTTTGFTIELIDGAGTKLDQVWNFIASQGVSYTPTPMSDKTVGGQVSSAGAIVAGTGFTVVRTALGNYQITFNTPFPSPPTVVGQVFSTPPGAQSNPSTIQLDNITTTGFLVRLFTPAQASFDGIFHFIASLGFTYAPTTLLGKMVAGSVGSTGAIVAGAGFTVTKGAAGIYTINFATPFATAPIVLVDGLAATGNPNIISVPTTTQVVITLGTSDQPFNFIACDPGLAVASSTLPATTIGSEWDYKQFVADLTVNPSATNTSEATAQNVIVGNTFTADGLKVRVEFAIARIANTAWGQELTLVLLRDSTVLGSWNMRLGDSPAPVNIPYNLVAYDTPSAGAHSYTIKAWVNASPVTLRAGPGGAGQLLPAFLRVTKAQ